MKIWKKISIFVILSLVICMAFATVAFATEAPEDVLTIGATETEDSGKLDMNEIPETFAERAGIALQGTVTGMVMVFSVLGLLAVIMTLSKIVFHDIPNKKKSPQVEQGEQVVETATIVEQAPVPVASGDDATVAAIIAAISAYIASDENLSEEYAGGFRVVSFKRVREKASWNAQK